MSKNTTVSIRKISPYEANLKLKKKLEVLLKKNTPQKRSLDTTYICEAITTGEFLLAETGNGKIVGIAYLWPLQDLDREDAIIKRLVVDEPYRLKGIGTKLVRKLIEIAKENGTEAILALGPVEDEVSKKFFQSLGGTPHLFGYSLPLT